MTLDSKVLLAAIQACVSEETGVRILFIAGEEFARVKAAAL